MTTRRHLLKLVPALALLPWFKPQAVGAEAADPAQTETTSQWWPPLPSTIKVMTDIHHPSGPGTTLYADEKTMAVFDELFASERARAACFEQGGVEFIPHGDYAWSCRLDDDMWIGSTGL